MAVLAAVAVGAAMGLAAWSLLATVFSEERAVADRLALLAAQEVHQAQLAEPLASPLSRRLFRPAGEVLDAVLALVVPSRLVARIELRITQAGLKRRIGANALFLAAGALGAGGLVAGGVGASLMGLPDATRFAFTALATVAGIAAPFLWLNDQVATRQGKIRRGLPDALDMLMISVEAGLGFDAALAKFVRSVDGPLAEEFGVMLAEMHAGMSRSDAFRHLVERTTVPELEAFSLAMVQADLLGMSVGNVLRVQSREMRVKRRQYAEEVAQKAPAKMVFPLILFILPATMIVLVGPAIIAIMRAFGSM